MGRADAVTWMALGEIQSKCDHLGNASLDPETAAMLHKIYLVKGIMATTAIEGNTLSESEVAKRIEGQLKLPASKEYLGKEVDNVLKATNFVLHEVMTREECNMSSSDIKKYHMQILEGLEVDDATIPGSIREHRVEVGRYRGAPPEDCEYLLGRMCEWLASSTFNPTPGRHVVFGVLKAILAHLYIAWIHPFGDGNGRTARLVEARLLLEAGAPSAAAHLLSNHYNQTRAEYYRQLDNASRSGGDVMPFIKYAVEGFCGQLKEQIKFVQNYQFKAVWQNFVHGEFRDKKSPSDHRRRHLALAVSETPEGYPLNQIRRLTPQLAELYAGKTLKTVMRDVNALIKMGIIERSGKNVRPATSKLEAFIPIRREPKILSA